MKKFHSPGDPLSDIIEILGKKSIRIPGTLAKVVDFDVSNNSYKFVVEFKENKYRDFILPTSSSFKSLSDAVKSFLSLN